MLLALGTGLIAVAAITFTAVNWRRLDATAQGLVLVALTGLAALGARRAMQRGLGATAEALGAVSVLLGLADVHALRVGLVPGADARAAWAGGLALVVLGAWLLAERANLRSPRLAAVALGQVPLLLAAASIEPGARALEMVALAQAAVVVVLAGRVARLERPARALATALALLAGASAVGSAAATLVIAGFRGDLREPAERSDLLLAVVTLLAGAAVASLAGWCHRGRRDAIDAAGAAAALLVIGASSWASAIVLAEGRPAVVALVAASGSVIARRLPTAARLAPTATFGIAGALASVPLLLTAGSMLDAAAEASSAPWIGSASTLARDLRLAEAPNLAPWALAIHLGAAALALLAAGGRLAGRARALGAGAWVATVVVVAPVALPLTIGSTVGIAVGLFVAAAVLGAVVATDEHRRWCALAAALALAWAASWGATTSDLTLLVALTSCAVGALLVVGARAAGDRTVGLGALSWVLVAVPGSVGLVLAAAEMGAAPAWAAATVASAVASMALVLLFDPAGRTAASGFDRAATSVVETGSLALHLLGLAVLVDQGDLDQLAIGLAAGTVAFGLHAARPGRSAVGGAAAVEGLLVTWLLLQRAEVGLVEAYVLPLALVLGAIGLAVDRRRAEAPLPSWVVLGPALVTALGPAVGLALIDGGPIRPLAGLVAGAVVLVVGAASGRRAPFDVGGAAVAVLGVRQLAPVVGELPNWVTIGSTGLVLLAVGATFEQRRQDLRVARHRYSSLT